MQSFSTQHGTDYGPMNALIFMSAIPVLIVYLLRRDTRRLSREGVWRYPGHPSLPPRP